MTLTEIFMVFFGGMMVLCLIIAIIEGLSRAWQERSQSK
jgi:hypothetical protein